MFPGGELPPELLGALGGEGGGLPPDLFGGEQPEAGPGDLPREMIDLCHQAIAVEPDVEDKALLGQILRMLLSYQAKQARQGQGQGGQQQQGQGASDPRQAILSRLGG